MTEDLRVLHLPVSSLPWLVGGKEVYTHQLAAALRACGSNAQVAIHRNPEIGESIGEHVHEGVPVSVLPEIPDAGARSAIYACDTQEIPGFEELLSHSRPRIVHFHDFSARANLTHLSAAIRAGARTVMTVHSPGQCCLQRELLYRGARVCDGELRIHRCTRCRLHQSGVPAGVDALLAAMPRLGLNAASGHPVARALTARQMTVAFIRAWRRMASMVDCIHVYADWLRAILLSNGVPPDKIFLCRTGTAHAPGDPDVQPSPRPDGTPLRLVFMGRCERVKGVHVLVDAFRRLSPDVAVEVQFFGPYWDKPYGQRLMRKIDGDVRLHTPRLIRPEDVSRALGEADACVVPSLWLETGPLVVVEAFAAGTPVIGSRLGGIAEQVSDGRNGLLFPPGDAAALAKIIARLSAEPRELTALRGHVTPPRSMYDVARDITGLYQRLLDSPDCS